MRIVSQLRIALSGLLVGTAACNLDVNDPFEGTPLDLSLDFCANDVPIWFAFQQGGQGFQVITPNASGTFNFTAENRVAIAYVRQNGTHYRTDLIYASNEALAELNNLSCVEETGTKAVDGSVAGLTGTQHAIASMSTASAIIPAGQTAYSLSQLVDRPLDLIGSRVDVVDNTQLANKTIIRRAQNPANGATMAVLDFDTQGFAPVQNMLSASGVAVTDEGVLSNSFHSALGTLHMLSFVGAVADGPVPMATIPEAEQVTGEYHEASLTSSSSNGAVRAAFRYFKAPGNQALTLGPPLIEPAVTVVGTTPYVRLRVQVQGQTEYSTLVNTAYHQQTANATVDVSLTVLASYFGGTPQEWNLPLPNFDGLPGWQNVWGLKTGAIDWTVTAYLGRPQVVLGAPPNFTAGETIAYGSRSAVFTATSVQGQQSQPRALPGRLNHFGRLAPRR